MISEKAEALGVSIAALIRMVLAEYSNDYTPSIECSDETVSYQRRGEKGKIFSINFSSEEYEMCMDLRKIWKFSVSFLVVQAFLYYLSNEDEMELDSGVISYVSPSYQIIKKYVKKQISLLIIWPKERKRPKKE